MWFSVRRGRAGRAFLALLLALAMFLPRVAVAEDVAKEPHPRSVYRIWPWADGAIIVGTNLLSAYLYFGVEADITCPCARSDVNSFDRWAIDHHSDTADLAATALVVASVAAPVALDIVDLQAWGPLTEDFVVMAEALSVSGALVSIAKTEFQRPYPRTYAGSKIEDSTNYASFYSGHTAIAFTGLSVAAMTIGRRHHRFVLPWLVTVGVGSAVGMGMVLSGWHFPTDVIVGGVMGTAVGMAVPALHFRQAPVRPVAMIGAGGTPMLGLVGTLP